MTIPLDIPVVARAVTLGKKRGILRLPGAIVEAAAKIHSLLPVSRSAEDFPAAPLGARAPYRLPAEWPPIGK